MTYAKRDLIPTPKPDDVLVLNNLGSHEGGAASQAMRDGGARLLFLSPYSPDPNLIEQVLVKQKALLHKTDARSIEQTWRGAGNVLGHFVSDECLRCLENSGNVLT